MLVVCMLVQYVIITSMGGVISSNVNDTTKQQQQQLNQHSQIPAAVRPRKMHEFWPIRFVVVRLQRERG
jgi:hypothetical protein